MPMMLDPLLARFRKPPPPEPRPLDEASLRRADFTPPSRCVGVKLGNGQVWSIPKPVLELRPTIAPSGHLAGFNEVPVYGDGATKSFGQEYLDLFADALASADESPIALMTATLRVVAFLLMQNYELDAGEASRLLPWLFDDEENASMWGELSAVIGGDSPKPSPGGEGSPT